jgi:hypothetical protein
LPREPHIKILPPQYFSILLLQVHNCYRLHLSLTQVYRSVGCHSHEHENVRNFTPAPTWYVYSCTAKYFKGAESKQLSLIFTSDYGTMILFFVFNSHISFMLCPLHVCIWFTGLAQVHILKSIVVSVKQASKWLYSLLSRNNETCQDGNKIKTFMNKGKLITIWEVLFCPYSNTHKNQWLTKHTAV